MRSGKNPTESSKDERKVERIAVGERERGANSSDSGV
jgi:hypothetical protein